MYPYNGTLNTNEIFSSIYNMIISQQVFADNFGTHQTLVDKARVDGGLLGDQKLYYAVDILSSKPWGADAEATNLLAVNRPDDPKCQSIVLDIFRQISLTVDNYLSKRAFSTETAFSEMNSVFLQMLRDTKKVYDGTLYNCYIGTTQTSTGAQMRTIDLTSASAGDPLYGLTGLEKERMEALLIAQDMADLFTEMGDYSRDFNDLQFLRSYSKDSIKFVWNAKYVNKLRKVDLPTIFHKDGVIEKLDEEVIAPRYFGTVITSSNVGTYSASTPTAGKPIDSDDDTYVPGVGHANGMLRSMIEKDVTVSGTDYHVFPGDEIPAGATIKASGTFEYGEVYIEQSDVICKVLTKLPPYMSAFTVETSFVNAKALLETHFLTFGHNKIEYLKNYPFITVKASY